MFSNILRHRTSLSVSYRRALSRSVIRLNTPPKDPKAHENGLYYGQFTKEEYENAANVVKQQIDKLENEIKGDFNIRENLGKVPQFPQRDPSGSTKVNNLTDLFIQTIKTTGPISLSAYIRQCLTHPDFGYYTTRNPLDLRSGDFITSPEISSVFGEMVGIWLFTIWQQQNYPPSIRLIEFGPGRGTLMYDVLKSFNLFVKKVGKKADVEINLVEASKVLRREQWKLLCDEANTPFETDANGFDFSTSQWGNTIRWLDTEKDIKKENDVANYIIAHEFFDALPVKGFKKTDNGWRELVVEHSSSVNNTQPKLPSNESVSSEESKDALLNTEFHLTLSPKETPSSIIPTLSSRFNDLPVDSRIEICTEAELYLMKMVQLLDNIKQLGAVLIIDYGVVDAIPESSLRGIYKHNFVSPFIKPGDVDLSVDVDFTNLQQLSARFCSTFGPVDQGDWLHRLGIGHRIDQLIKKNSDYPEEQDKIYQSYRRLTDKDEKSMGKVYKFLALLPSGSKEPAGFSDPL